MPSQPHSPGPLKEKALSPAQKRAFAARMLRVYGLRIDPENELLPIYYLSYASARHCSVSVAGSARLLSDAVTGFETTLARRLSELPTETYHFSSAKAAFWFGFGKWGVVSSVALIVCSVLGFTGIQALSGSDQAAAFVKAHPDIVAYGQLCRKTRVRTRLLNNRITAYIELQPAYLLDSALTGEHAVIDLRRKKILVPLSQWTNDP
jgi:hypothetical protein